MVVTRNASDGFSITRTPFDRTFRRASREDGPHALVPIQLRPRYRSRSPARRRLFKERLPRCPLAHDTLDDLLGGGRELGSLYRRSAAGSARPVPEQRARREARDVWNRRA